MELVSAHVHRALAYLQLLNDHGFDPTSEHLDTFACAPSPRDAEHGLPFIPHFPEARIRSADPIVGYLHEMEWVEISAEPDRRVHLTELGRVVLRGLGPEGPEEPLLPTVADVLLEPTDPLAWVNLTRVVAQAGAGMLVDPYFKANFVPWLVESTSIQRVLISSRHPRASRDISLIAIAMATVPNAEQLQVRSTDAPELHDRCLIAADGTVRLLGTSVNSVGRSMTAVIKPDPEVMRTYRDRHEALWNAATIVTPQAPGDDPPLALNP